MLMSAVWAAAAKCFLLNVSFRTLRFGIVRDQAMLCGLHVNIIEAFADRMNPAGDKKYYRAVASEH